jgi:hypothetical protein
MAEAASTPGSTLRGALAIGRAIGDKVIVIGPRPAGSLAAYGLRLNPALRTGRRDCFISPNFGVKAAGAEILTLPWQQIAELVAGKERNFVPRNALHEKSDLPLPD